ncbi:hypothetical protein COMA2_30076 [Candidatus Nitrospira nitrificans]|uniref:Uncharacterized protein n=1 Tax=Candidatus Nitrospira nitrificans TaxID=1742973 RepID=A0A0S4LHP5_9BACT|nr:hypothetical protein [Candidatus Nitrospira nitrificans]CUS37100.1 hypothetical protein COMA2_30076 [Candidatus Nitrospira nitrificans]
MPQRITSPKAIEAYFEQKTKTLNNFQKAIIRKRWATMEELMSAEERKARIAASIIHDFDTKPRLNNDRGTAILVAASIYDACHYYRIFHSKPFGQYCGIITSFEPNATAISKSLRTATNATSSTPTRSMSSRARRRRKPRGRSQAPLHRGACEHEAPDRREQTPDRL